MRKPLAELVDDYFRNSPDWPIAKADIDVEAEVANFMRDESDWPDAERYAADAVQAEIKKFVDALT